MLPKLKRMLSFQPKSSKDNGEEKKLSALFALGFSCVLDSLSSTVPMDALRDVYVSEMFLLKRKVKDGDKTTDKRNGARSRRNEEKGKGHYLVATLKVGKKTRGHWCITSSGTTGYEVRAIERPFDSLSDRVVACFRFPASFTSPGLSSSTQPSSDSAAPCSPSETTPPLTLPELLITAQTISTSQITPLLTSKNHELTTILLQLILERHNVPPSRQSFTLSSSSAAGLKALSSSASTFAKPPSFEPTPPSNPLFPRSNVLRKLIRSYYWQICIGLPRELGVERVPKRELGLLRGAVERAVRAHHEERAQQLQRRDVQFQPQHVRLAQSQPQLSNLPPNRGYECDYDRDKKLCFERDVMRYERVEVSFYDAHNDAAGGDRRVEEEEEGDEATVCEGYEDRKVSL